MTANAKRLSLSLGAALVAALAAVLAAVLLAVQVGARPALATKRIALAAAGIQPGTRLRAELLRLEDWPAGQRVALSAAKL